MAPLGENGDFGYSDRDLGDDLIEVSYVGAPVSVAAASPSGNPKIGPEQDKVRDLALWRAAELALGAGFAGFGVEQETRDNEFRIRDEIARRPPFFPLHGYYGGYYGAHYHRPWWFADDYATHETRRRASLRAKITLRIKLVKAVDASEPLVLDAGATRKRIEALRGDAVY